MAFGERGQPSPRNGGTLDQGMRRGQPKTLITTAKDKRGDHLHEGDERKCTRDPKGSDYGSTSPILVASVATLPLARRTGEQHK